MDMPTGAGLVHQPVIFNAQWAVDRWIDELREKKTEADRLAREKKDRRYAVKKISEDNPFGSVGLTTVVMQWALKLGLGR